jgi:hypothetical protein
MQRLSVILSPDVIGAKNLGGEENDVMRLLRGLRPSQ